MNNKGLILAAIAAAILCWLASYAAIRNTLNKLASEVASLKADIHALNGCIPPLYGTRHVAIRQSSIYAQAQQFQEDYVLIVGDSITEALYLPRIARYPVLNGGMGGAGVQVARELLDGFPKGRRIKGIVIAIGVNDGARASLRPDYFDEWEKSYLSIVRQAKALAVKTVALNTVIPVEQGKPLGDQYFDPDAIERLNDIIRKAAASDHTLILIDNDATFRHLTSKQQAYTLDGVHLNAIGYASWKSNLAAAFKH